MISALTSLKNISHAFKLLLVIFLLRECIHDWKMIIDTFNKKPSVFSEFGLFLSSLLNLSAAATLVHHRYEILTDEHHSGMFLFILRVVSSVPAFALLIAGMSGNKLFLFFPIVYGFHFWTWKTDKRWLKTLSALALIINAALGFWAINDLVPEVKLGH